MSLLQGIPILRIPPNTETDQYRIFEIYVKIRMSPVTGQLLGSAFSIIQYCFASSSRSCPFNYLAIDTIDFCRSYSLDFIFIFGLMKTIRLHLTRLIILFSSNLVSLPLELSFCVCLISTLSVCIMKFTPNTVIPFLS
jgi:hypothetical protein